jgi:hypothetical protein
MQQHIEHFDRTHHLPQQAEEEEEQTSIQLDEDSGLKNYFKEIVKNAGRFGDKIDLTQY